MSSKRACLLGLVVLTLVTTVPGSTAEMHLLHGPGEVVVPERSLVKVILQRESVGVLVKNRFIPETRVHSVAQFSGAIVDRARRVVAYIGDGFLSEAAAPGARFTVRSYDGKEYRAELAGLDERVSLIVLKTELPLGEAVTFSPGTRKDRHFNLVSAAPNGNGWNVTSPCAVDLAQKSWLPVVELKISKLDAPQQGCSWEGAFVLDLQGRLKGLVTRVRSHRFSKKLSLSQILPSQMIESSVARLIKTGRNIPAGWLGVYLDTTEAGIKIAKTVPASPAERAGLKPGDQIVGFDGEELSELDDLVQGIRWRGPDGYCSLTVNREGLNRKVNLVLGRQMHKHRLAWALDLSDDPSGKGAMRVYRTVLPPMLHLGFLVDPVSAEEARQLSSPTLGGLLVSKVLDDSSAQRAGFAPRDLIFEINGSQILSLADVQQCLEAAAEGFLKIRFLRDGKVLVRKVALQ